MAALVEAADSVSIGFDEALELVGPLPQSPEAFAELGKIERTAAAAALKRFEQLQDIVARTFRTALLADGVDISSMTARDIANRMEKFGALPDARSWSEIVRLRNRLAHEYPVSRAERYDRFQAVISQAKKLHAIRADLIAFLRRQALID